MKDGKTRQNSGDNWATPRHVYNKLNEEFNFTFDPCPLRTTDKITPGNKNLNSTDWDGLAVNWRKSNFINPPYSLELKVAFVKKAIEESKKGKTCVLLIPVSTSTRLFHDLIVPNAKEIRFVDKRISFEGVNTLGQRVSTKSGMHDSMIVVLGRNFGSPRFTVWKQDPSYEFVFDKLPVKLPVISSDTRLTKQHRKILHHIYSQKECYTTIQEFMYVIHKSEKTVRRRIKELEKWGIITSKKEHKGQSKPKRLLTINNVSKPENKTKIINL